MDIVENIHEKLYGSESPIRDTDWTMDIERVVKVAKQLYPTSTLMDILYKIIKWLENVDREDQADNIWKYIYEHREELF